MRLLGRKTLLIMTTLGACALMTGCSSSETASNVTAETTTVSENICESSSTQIIDYGRKATAGTTAGLRGAFSDIALNPTNDRPATVYTDTGSLSLKYSYWNGSTFAQETIAGGLTTNFPRLVFLASGRPLVFWTNGATAIYMASRDSLESTNSSWTVSTIDTVATMTTRALEVSVNANDEVGIVYLSAVGTLARFIGCKSNCQTASNYFAMGVITNYITNTASATANSTDIQWCNTGSGYRPYVVYGGTAGSVIARCTQSDLANCANPGSWETAIITDGVVPTGNNQVSTKMSIDSTSDSPFYVYAKTSANEIRVYQQGTGGCSSGALAFSAISRQIAAGANLGNAWMRVQRDSSGRTHLVLNEALTNIRYFNQLTGNPTDAWSTVGNIETVGAAGLPAAGSTRGAFVVDENNDQLLVTYGRTNAVTPASTYGNLVLAYNQCPSGSSGCGASTLASPSNATGMVYGNSPIDSSGQLSLTTAQLPKTTSVAVTSTHSPAAAYIDFSIGSNTTGRIKYAFRSGTRPSDSWSINEVPGPVSPQSVSLKFDHNDKPWIAYYDASSLRYYLTTNALTNGTGVWITYQFPIAAATAATLPAVNSATLTMSYSSGVAKPLMIVVNSGAATKVVRAAIFDSTTESWSSNLQIDAGTANFSKVSADSDTSGNVALAYYDTTNNAIKYASSTNGGSSWAAATTIITVSGGMGLELKLNPTNSKPALAFIDRANNLQRYRECTTSVSSCSSSSNWGTIGAGVIDASLGVSTLTAAATDGLLSSALSFTSTGKPWVVYPTGSLSSTGSLFYSYSSSSLGGLFSTPVALSQGRNATTNTPVVATPANFTMGGWSPSSAMSSDGTLHTVYVGPGNYLYATSCGN